MGGGFRAGSFVAEFNRVAVRVLDRAVVPSGGGRIERLVLPLPRCRLYNDILSFFGAVPFDAALPTLAKNADVREFLANVLDAGQLQEAVGKLESGALDGGLGDHVHDLLLDAILNTPTEAWRGLLDGGDEYGDCSISVMEYGGVYFVRAPEGELSGYFLGFDAALNFVNCGLGDVQEARVCPFCDACGRPVEKICGHWVGVDSSDGSRHGPLAEGASVSVVHTFRKFPSRLRAPLIGSSPPEVARVLRGVQRRGRNWWRSSRGLIESEEIEVDEGSGTWAYRAWFHADPAFATNTALAAERTVAWLEAQAPTDAGSAGP